MRLTGGYPFSLINDGLPFSYPKLLANAETHTAIIGGGISGALTAYYLTDAGIECMLVDGRTIGLGSTCASTSLLQYELDTPLHLLKKRLGKNVAETAYKLCGDSIDTLIHIMDSIGFTDYSRSGSLFFSTHHSEKKFMDREFSARRDAGFHVEFLSCGDLRQEYGLHATRAILSEKGCVGNAYTLTHALLQHSMKKGLKVFDRTHVSQVDYSKNIVLKTSDGYYIRAKNLINASGYEVVNFINKDIADLYCTYAAISEQAPEQSARWKNNVMMWNTDDPYLYMRLTSDNRVIVGGRDDHFTNASTRETTLEKKGRLLQKDLLKIFPDLDFKREFVWCGTFAKTKDSLPYIGAYKKTPNTYYALGFGGNGITYSVIAAEILRDIVCGKPNAATNIFSFER